ncbi:MAG: outer membrane protein multidrug efflux system [Acidobacteriaceae bacterium]|jgi:multidrug efflux system outer membrane protein|nr:outer membrane protein multidrug efflux system [Acidobacteriaceae bacterium]
MACSSTYFLAAAVATLLGACTLEPHYNRPPPPVPALQGGTAGDTAAADIGWREFFPDPQLQQLIALALTDNRDLRVAALNVQSAQAQYRIQRASLFPTVDASAVEQVQHIPIGVLTSGFPPAVLAGAGPLSTNGVTEHTYDVGVGFTSYELDLFGRIRSLNHAALQQYFSSGETRRSVQLTLVAEVATAYVAVLADQTLLDITRDTLKSQEDSYALTQKQFSGGTTTELALRQAESTVDTARANLAQYNRQQALDRDALQLLLGAPIPDGIDFSGGLDRGNMVAELEEGIPSDVLVRRPDVLAAEHQLMAANAEIGAARAAFLPAISLTGNFGTESTQLSGLFKGGSRAWTFSPQISVPIFAGGANVANLQATKLARDTGIAQYEKAIQTAFREVADALVARGTLDEQLAAQQALVTASEKAYRLADMRYRGGVDSYLSALDAQRTLYSAQQQLQTVRLLRLQNLVTLYKALGGGLREHAAAAQTTLEPSSSESVPTHAGPSASN